MRSERSIPVLEFERSSKSAEDSGVEESARAERAVTPVERSFNGRSTLVERPFNARSAAVERPLPPGVSGGGGGSPRRAAAEARPAARRCSVSATARAASSSYTLRACPSRTRPPEMPPVQERAANRRGLILAHSSSGHLATTARAMSSPGSVHGGSSRHAARIRRAHAPSSTEVRPSTKPGAMKASKSNGIGSWWGAVMEARPKRAGARTEGRREAGGRRACGDQRDQARAGSM